jgi:hypothetical protein
MMVPPRARKVFGDAINSSIATILQWRPKGTECACVPDPHTFAGRADLLAGRINAFGLDVGTVARVEPITFRKLQNVCATCEWHELCRWDMRYDPIDVVSRKYCPNSAMLSALAPTASSLSEWRVPLTLF